MLRIMLVDDDKLIRDDIKTYFDWEKEGYCICAEATNGESALNQLKDADPDIILTDISMPHLNGVELIKRLNEMSFSGKIIVMSNYDDFDYVKDAMKFGAYDYCLKYKMSPNSLLKLLNEASSGIHRIENKDPQESEDLSFTFLRAFDGQLADSYEDTNSFYMLLYIRHRYGKLITIHSVPMLPLKTFLVQITENETVIIIDNDYHSASGQTAIMQRLSRELLSVFPDSIISYSTEPITLRSFKRKIEELWLSADRFFYLHTRIIQSEKNFRFQRFLDPSTKSKLTDAFQKAILNLDSESFYDITETAFDLFHKEQIRPKTVFMYFEDLLFLLEQMLSPVIQFPERNTFTNTELARHITSDDAKQMLVSAVKPLFSMVNDVNKPEIIRAIYYIHANYMNKLTLIEVADYVGLSRNHFCKVFHEEVGITFVTYIQNVRLEKAKKLLKDGKYRIQEIANIVGIDNYRYFCKLFRDYTGYNPSEYKGK